MSETRPQLGIVQARGLGDIIIALPIAKHWHDQGWDIHWPIDSQFMPSLAGMADYVNFIPFDFTPNFMGYVMNPVRLLKGKGCQKVFTLYSYLTGIKVCDPVLSSKLKFDEYKYAVSEVPFHKKWELSLRRNPQREQQLYDRLVTTPDYVVTHLTGSNFKCRYVPDPALAGLPVINIDSQTDSIFDWLKIIENARHLYMVDSCFSNLVEQLNLLTPKTLYLRSAENFTPVMKNGWNFTQAKALK